ncbi:anaphase promoting complex subunit 1 NDAI_0F03300 [Naumovozyma dairenensis CBS 421]|uniref:Uncharacterized protein n=1 Tax=Naumovozyma dairenensis (strain ATCC 10597 / BCRC 20456 / CBS 421 / NBRC 0211 / NRRL Y-12639) TaxID=1071378 RepID=G0WCY7_NAUDC|nr:hypothetical protein NDAI_0F03300 [Naumovozyma dairenensis CBS 421]CCD25648.1 hypothetical protein NDAI_0F03300 [Naumovozyma dairenensis CBS 421]
MDFNNCLRADPLRRGDLWIDENKRTVHLFIGGVCVKKFRFQEKIINCGIVDFERASDCLVIVLSDVAHVYYLSTGGSTSVSFPYTISNAFFYPYGIVLERNDTKDDAGPFNTTDVQFKFITLTDPMAPFGTLSFATKQSMDGIYNMTMVVFPREANDKITAFYDQRENSVHFYYTRILNTNSSAGQTHSKKDTIHSSAYSNMGCNNLNLDENNRNLRKVSILNRRTASINSNYDINNNNSSRNSSSTLRSTNVITKNSDLDSFLKIENNDVSQSVPTRSVSATLDRMSNTSTNSPVIDSTYQTPQEYINQKALSKDIILTKISSLNLPSTLHSNSHSPEFIPVRYESKEAIIILDATSHFSKVWSINLLPSVVNSVPFKMYGDSPQDLIQLSSINTNVDFHIETIHSHPFLFPPGTVLISYEVNTLGSLYNPFIPLNSEIITLYDEDQILERRERRSESPDDIEIDEYIHFHIDCLNQIQDVFCFPTQSSVIQCLEALELICPNNIFTGFLFLWQYIYYLMKSEQLKQNEDTLNSTVGEEFESFLMALLCLLGDATNKDIGSKVINCAANQYLHSLDLVHYVPQIVLGLHLLREEFLLNTLRKNEAIKLKDFLVTAVYFMNWPLSWKNYYPTDSRTRMKYQQQLPSKIQYNQPNDEPPSIMKSLYSITENSQIPLTPYISFSRLIEKASDIDLLITPRCIRLLKLYELTHIPGRPNFFTLGFLTSLGISNSELNTYPIGIITPLRTILKSIERHISFADKELDLSTIARSDLERHIALIKQIEFDQKSEEELSSPSSFSNLTSFKVRNSTIHTNSRRMPRNIYTVISEVVKDSAFVSSEDNALLSSDKEYLLKQNEDQNNLVSKENTELIFSHDRRFDEALSLVNYFDIHKVHFIPTETKYKSILEEKKAVVALTALRTSTAGIGYSAILYGCEQPLSTQKWTPKPVNLECLFPDGTNISKSMNLSKNVTALADFHAGVSSGLIISRHATGITGSWIVFNKPSELNAHHGGFLFGLGLNGHLKNLEEWHVYNYLSPKVTKISIGLLLGMCASMKSTMDLKLTKVLSVHVVALLPQGSNDLNIAIEVQTVALVGIGLLYQQSNHRRMSSLLLSQLTSLVQIHEEMVVHESYRVGAGIALGLINLGSGKNFSSSEENGGHKSEDDGLFQDDLNLDGEAEELYPSLINDLLSIITETHEVEPNWVPEDSHSGALLALTFIFLRTRDKHIADLIKPNLKKNAVINHRSHLFLLKELSYHMILWDTIEDSLEFVLGGMDIALSDQLSAKDLPIYLVMAGRVLAMGIKFASTSNIKVRDILLSLLDRFVPFYQYFGKRNVDEVLIISGITTLVNSLMISASMIMCATGDLEVFRRVRFVHETIFGLHSYLFKRAKKKTRINPIVREFAAEHGDEHDFVMFDSEFSPGANENGSAEEDDAEEEQEEEEDEIGDETDTRESLENIIGIRKDVDFEAHYSKYMSTNLSLGFLFLGSGQYALMTSTSENIAYLILSILPDLDSQLEECLKYFWSMTIEPRCLVIKDSVTEEVINNVPIKIYLRSEHLSGDLVAKNLESPCLLPDFKHIDKIVIDSPDYHPLEIEFNETITAMRYFANGTVIYVKPKDRHNSYDEEKQKFPNVENIHMALQQKIKAIDGKVSLNNKKNITMVNFASNLINRLNMMNPTMLELERELQEKNESIDSAEDFNLDMIYSDCSNNDNITTDYQLEIWKKQALSLGQR